ncbi:hypothetical protein [Absidia glauca]|uniref:Non-homologous end-joining factor 1 n=1 Tax=Absidia glauca TaxID=4829 RepID=A0A163KEJ7_ABSGL|nr:hypothetical protein [Absidia glauca]
MLLSIDDNASLLTIPWTRFDNNISSDKSDNAFTDPLYIKTLFDQDVYRILVTNLRYVWFERGDAASITKTASSHRLEITSDEQVKILMCSLQRCFLQPDNCDFVVSEKGQLLIEYKETNQGFTSLSWTFHCSPLETALVGNANNKALLDGPTVLYTHFISPLVAVTNSQWLDSKDEGALEEDVVSFSPSSQDQHTSRTQDDWLSQMSYVATEQTQDYDLLSPKMDPEEGSSQSPHNDLSSQALSTSPVKKLTDPEKELERRLKLESELSKKKELKKKKRRLF